MTEPQVDTPTINAVKIIRYISIALFLVSLTQNTFSTGDDGDGTGTSGIIDLLAGTLFFYTSPAAWVWFANPLLLIAWIYLFTKPKASLVTSLLAAVISLSFILFDSIRTDEGGGLHPIAGYEIGYGLWVTSCLLMLFANVYRKWLVNILTDEH
jgi:hypothetical protein